MSIRRALLDGGSTFIVLSGFTLTCLVAQGCSANLPQGVAISGSVTYNGDMLTGGTVFYDPVDAEQGRAAMGTIGPDGKFQMETSNGIRGVLPGEYHIRIESVAGHVAGGVPPSESTDDRMVDSAIPEKYRQSGTSGLSDSVGPEHSGVMDIELSDE